MKKIRRFITICTYIFIVVFLSVASLLLTSYLLGPPPITNNERTVIYDRDETEIEQQPDHTVSLKEISKDLLAATILAEDQHFYEHHGFDVKGIIRAIMKNIRSSSLKEGASTISQQLARNLYLTHEKTWSRKLKEAFFTIRLEMFYTKEEILTGYVNSIYYGHGAYGIGEASTVYFDKHPRDLSLAEAAMLAGIPKGPTYYSPFNDEKKAYHRQQYILQQLLQKEKITEAEYFLAKNERLPLKEPHVHTDSFAKYYMDVVVKEAERMLRIDQESIRSGSFKIYTTLDRDIQQAIEKRAEQQLDDSSDLEIGVITLDPETGAILGLIGGKDYHTSPFNRATDAKRMVGSTFKPLLYYVALENGYTPTTMLLSEPTAFVLADGEAYEPRNYNGYYAHKPISLAQAMALSDNIYAVKTNLFLSPELVSQSSKKFGISSELPNVASLALGSASISLLEMVQSYGMIANGGKEVDSYTIERIENKHGKVVYERQTTPRKQLLDENKTFILTHLMTGMFDRRLNGYMEVTGSSLIDQLSQAYAGKSGTTNFDNWMIGFSPKLVTGVWTGYDQHQPIQKSQEKVIAKNFWAEIMEEAHKHEESLQFDIPDGVVKKVIDVETGLLATKDCKITKATYFEKGTEPTHYCDRHLPTNHSSEEENEKRSIYHQLLELFR